MFGKKKKKGCSGDELFDMAFEMKFQAKSLDKQAAKIESKMKKEEAKVLQLMNSGNHEAAKISAGGCISMKNEALNTRRMAAKVGAVAQKLDSAYRATTMSESMKNAVPMIKKGLKAMEKMGIDKAMFEFDSAMENLDVKSDSIGAAMEGVHAGSVDQTQVDGYLSALMDSQANDMQSKYYFPIFLIFYL
jgi:charged multivesicular body protein 1